MGISGVASPLEHPTCMVVELSTDFEAWKDTEESKKRAMAVENLTKLLRASSIYI